MYNHTFYRLLFTGTCLDLEVFYYTYFDYRHLITGISFNLLRMNFVGNIFKKIVAEKEIYMDSDMKLI
jgi:hypothetical protein